MNICTLGERLRHWTIAYPSHEDGLGLRTLRETWKLIRVDEIGADPQLTTIVQAIITKREVNPQGARDGKQTRNRQSA
jgi:hypothetical protein